MIETKTRINLFKNIINNHSIHSILVHSISRDHVPRELLDFKEHSKVKFISDPIYDDIEMYNFGTPKEKRVKLLYFGTFFFSKGVDILIEAWNKTESNNIDLMNYIDSYLKKFDVKGKLIQGGKNQFNFHCVIGPNKDDGIIFSGHTDVVPVEGQDGCQTHLNY